jgi:uncharacterized membrane protein
MRWLSLGVLAGSATIVLALWDRVPDRWVVHWGANGEPDGWAEKSIAGTLMLPLIGLAIWVFVELLGWAMGLQAAADKPRRPPEVVAIVKGVARAIMLAVAVIFGALTVLLPLAQPRTSGWIVVASFAIVIGSILGSMLWARARARALRSRGVVLPGGYESVLFYRNADDPRVWVPKLVGIGWTLNFAHPAAWLWLLFLAGLPLAVVLGLTIAAVAAG